MAIDLSDIYCGACGMFVHVDVCFCAGACYRTLAVLFLSTYMCGKRR